MIAATRSCDERKARLMTRQKYFWTPDHDALLRRYYDPNVRGRARDIAAHLGVPKWVVWERASALGLTRPRDIPWSPSDVAYLEANFHRAHIKQIAKELGRTVTAVKRKAERLGYRKNGEGYNSHSLALALGVDHHWVSQRIRDGKINAGRRFTERTVQEKGDSYLITDQDVLRFIREHTFEVDLRKVDQLWFLDLVHEALNSINWWEGPVRRQYPKTHLVAEIHPGECDIRTVCGQRSPAIWVSNVELFQAETPPIDQCSRCRAAIRARDRTARKEPRDGDRGMFLREEGKR